MKRLVSLVVVVFMLCGCQADNSELSAVMDFRNRLQQSKGCNFTAKISADYGSVVYQFTLDCEADQSGNLTFHVIAPDSISGISGQIDGLGGKMTFDDKMLAFDTMADGQVTPVSAPWVMVKTLLGGYITAAGRDKEDIRAVMNDSYREQALEVDVWFDSSVLPKHCEILWQGRRVLSLDVEKFVIL